MSEIKNYINNSIKKIKDNPGTIFGLLYPYILTIVVGIGTVYISNMDNVAKQKVPPILGDTLVVEDLPEMSAKLIPPVDVFTIKEASPEILAQGKEFYNTICASCHNTTGMGGGPAAVGLNPAPRNLTSSDGWKNGMKFSEIYTTLQEGLAGSSMISYDYLTPAERISIIHFIRKEFVNNPAEITDDELTALDLTYNLSAGMNLPAQISVQSAMEIILEDSEPDYVKVENTLNHLSISNDENVTLFKSVSRDDRKVISLLTNSIDWKSSTESFISFVNLNIYNGFNSRILNLSDSEWNQLYNFLLSTI